MPGMAGHDEPKWDVLDATRTCLAEVGSIGCDQDMLSRGGWDVSNHAELIRRHVRGGREVKTGCQSGACSKKVVGLTSHAKLTLGMLEMVGMPRLARPEHIGPRRSGRAEGAELAEACRRHRAGRGGTLR